MLFTTGGTVASLEGENGLVPELHADDLLSYIPELNVRCRMKRKSCHYDSMSRRRRRHGYI